MPPQIPVALGIWLQGYQQHSNPTVKVADARGGSDRDSGYGGGGARGGRAGGGGRLDVVKYWKSGISNFQ